MTIQRLIEVIVSCCILSNKLNRILVCCCCCCWCHLLFVGHGSLIVSMGLLCMFRCFPAIVIILSLQWWIVIYPSNTVLDHSGFRIHYTKHLRKEDAGMMISGVSVSDTQLIPPQQKLYRNVGICGPSCTSTVSIATNVHYITIYVLSLGKPHMLIVRQRPFFVRTGRN